MYVYVCLCMYVCYFDSYFDYVSLCFIEIVTACRVLDVSQISSLTCGFYNSIFMLCIVLFCIVWYSIVLYNIA